MISSIFRPRRSRAWPEPRTPLTESTMLGLPRPCAGRARRLDAGHRSEARHQALQRRPRGILVGLLLGRAMPGAERLGARKHDRRVLALRADLRALAVVDRRLSEPLLRDLLQAALEVLVVRGLGQRAVSVEVVVVGGAVAGVEEDRADQPRQ